MLKDNVGEVLYLAEAGAHLMRLRSIGYVMACRGCDCAGLAGQDIYLRVWLFVNYSVTACIAPMIVAKQCLLCNCEVLNG